MAPKGGFAKTMSNLPEVAVRHRSLRSFRATNASVAMWTFLNFFPLPQKIQPMFFGKTAEFPAEVPSHLPSCPNDLKHLTLRLHEVDLDFPLAVSLRIEMRRLVVV
jgi:hypothetical protein